MLGRTRFTQFLHPFPSVTNSQTLAGQQAFGRKPILCGPPLFLKMTVVSCLARPESCFCAWLNREGDVLTASPLLCRVGAPWPWGRPSRSRRRGFTGLARVAQREGDGPRHPPCRPGTPLLVEGVPRLVPPLRQQNKHGPARPAAQWPPAVAEPAPPRARRRQWGVDRPASAGGRGGAPPCDVVVARRRHWPEVRGAGAGRARRRWQRAGAAAAGGARRPGRP